MHTHKVMRNTCFSLLQNIVLLVLQFVARKIFIEYLGAELLGLNSLYANLLGLLNLSELGVGIAVQFNLYRPIVDGDKDRIAGILETARKIYFRIGLVVLASGAIMSLFVQYVIKDNTLPLWFIRVAFLINVAATASSYFFSHKRLFLQANEEIFINNAVDMVFGVGILIIKILLVIHTGNYFLYLIMDIVQKLFSNLCIAVVFRKRHGDITTAEKKETNVRCLLKDIRDVIPLKLGNYIFASTDSIIISGFLGLTAVNLYANYSMIYNQVISLSYYLAEAVKSSYGKLLKENGNKKLLFSILQEYLLLQFFISSICAVVLYILIDDFIIWWLGDNYVISNLCKTLLTMDFFIHSMFQPMSAIYGAAGKFKEDKKITIFMALINIIISVAAIRIMGLGGVILGTLISNCFCMIFRIYQIIFKFFRENILKFCRKILVFHVVVLLEILFGKLLYTKFLLLFNIKFLTFFISGLTLSLVVLVFNILIFKHTEEFNKIYQRTLLVFRSRK